MVLLTRLSKQVYRRSDEALLGMHLRLLMALSYVRDHDGAPQQELVRFAASGLASAPATLGAELARLLVEAS